MIAKAMTVLAVVLVIGALVWTPAGTARAADGRRSWSHHAPRSFHRPTIVRRPRYVPRVQTYRHSVPYYRSHRPVYRSYTWRTYPSYGYAYPRPYYGYTYRPYCRSTYYYPSSGVYLQYYGDRWSVGFGYNW